MSEAGARTPNSASTSRKAKYTAVRTRQRDARVLTTCQSSVSVQRSRMRNRS